MEIARRADRREVLDPAFARALNWVAAAIDRSLAAAVAPPVADAVHDRHTDDVEPLRALRRRAIALGVAIDDVLDAVMAEEAIREARSFPFRG